ncbi:hypothetical protein H2198_001930 [Neophaeococcomyces mojaviensis]|uniref:Uncharacterized protein n=1 Tax=Neophaeococcomyces mojaviensis TaxID=3383035 RepID=A0ACC3AGB2_9EURO|nr:hypothetical protein H2198_001930 [Knufia sp. JES_112]
MAVKSPFSIVSVRSVKSPAEVKIKSPLRNLFSPTSTHFANKKEEAELLGTQDFRYNVLEPNGILVADGHIQEDTWTRLAFSLGIPLKQDIKQTADVARFSYRMRKRKVVSDAQSVEYLASLIYSLSSPLSLSQQETSAFHVDAVPTAEEHKNTMRRLPRPAPSISIGYEPKTFDQIDEELQEGIIADEEGCPVNLGHISEPIEDQYWPFLVVEVSDHSMLAAKHACAVAAASCNNAVRLLSHAASEERGHSASNSFATDTNTRYCFSLAVSGKIACLNVHGSEGKAHHVASTIRTYCLEDDMDIAAMTDRLKSILVWGRFSRLQDIIDKLEALDRKVNGANKTFCMVTYTDDFDPAIFKTLDLRASKNKKKVAAQGALPGWVRHGGMMTG